MGTTCSPSETRSLQTQQILCPLSNKHVAFRVSLHRQSWLTLSQNFGFPKKNISSFQPMDFSSPHNIERPLLWHNTDKTRQEHQSKSTYKILIYFNNLTVTYLHDIYKVAHNTWVVRTGYWEYTQIYTIICVYYLLTVNCSRYLWGRACRYDTLWLGRWYYIYRKSND